MASIFKQKTKVTQGQRIMNSFKFRLLSEFEREKFMQGFREELSFLDEVKDDLETHFDGQKCKDFYQQRARAVKLEKQLKTKIKQMEVEKHLQVFSASIPEIKKLQEKLKKRLVKQVDPQDVRKNLTFLKERLQEEVLQQECDLKQGFQNFPITSQEINYITD
ncbi:MAG: hypothetical protein S4CHLAM7_04020 [Chlamydiae bacterium]|nr:hypothetical protein [Chlamydiota bacterium]